MNGVEILLIIGGGIAVSAVAKRRGADSGLIIMVLAAAASFIPGTPRLHLEPELLLTIVVPPLLYSATRGTSFSGFGANLHSIYSLGVILVLVTTGALGLISGWLLPSIGAAAAFVLGAVLAPPDTITTVSHGDEIGLPKRITSILTGESLVNDATALTLFTIAVAWVNGSHTGWGNGILQFLRTAFVGVAIGLALAWVVLLLRKRLGNAVLETSLVLLLPFTAYLAAEQLSASGILAVVAAAFSVSVNLSLDPKHQYPGAYRTRLQEEQVWQVVDFLLETFVFAYIGLQLRFVLHDLAQSSEPGLKRVLFAAGVLLVAAILIRILGVYVLFGRWALRDVITRRRVARDPSYAARYQERVERQRESGGEPLDAPSPKEIAVVAWTGMRGILTLAAAGAVPEHTTSGAPFPGRDAVQAIALLVTLGTMLIQGLPLPRLVRWLKFDLSKEKAAEEEVRQHALTLVAEVAAKPHADIDAVYEEQRLALGQAVSDHTLTEDVAREMIEDIDLRQAARHTAPPAALSALPTSVTSVTEPPAGSSPQA